MSEKSAFHIARMDSIRGTAILLVLLYHTLLVVFPGIQNQIVNPQLWYKESNLFWVLFMMLPPVQGWIGVELFLVISGFLIHLMYIKQGRELNIAAFFGKRFWRIYPPYLLVLLFFFFFPPGHLRPGIKDFLFHAGMIHNLSNDTFFSINPSLWSVALECQLYLLYPVLLFLLRRTNPFRLLLFIAGLHIILSIIPLWIEMRSLSYGNSVFRYWIVWYAGAFLAEYFAAGKRIWKNPGWICLASYVFMLILKGVSLGKPLSMLSATISCVAFTEMILHASGLEKWEWQRLQMKGIAWVGMISYSLYLIHQPYLGILIRWFSPDTSFSYLRTGTGILLSYLLLLLISAFLYRYLEQKSIGIGRYFRSRS